MTRGLRIGLAAALALAAGLVSWVTCLGETRADQEAALGRNARDAALAVEAYLDGLQHQIAWLVRPGSEATEAEDTRFILDAAPAVVTLRRIDLRGRQTYMASRAGFRRGDADVSRSRVVLAADPSAAWISPVRRASDGAHADLAVAHAQGGIAVADLNLGFLGDVLDAADVGGTTTLALVDDGGQPIAGAIGEGRSASVPLPRAGWTLRASARPALPALPRLGERFAALLGPLAALAWLIGRLVRPN